MKRLILVFISLLSVLFLAGCGDRVTINSGEVGKQLTTEGLEDIIRDPGSFRMNVCFPWEACPKLVRLETAVSAQEITVDSVFLPESKIILENVKFGIQYKIRDDKASKDAAFATMRPKVVGERELLITTEDVFSTYIVRKAPETVIVALRGYTVEQSLVEVEKISSYVKDALNESLKNTPVVITEFGFPNGVGVPPKLVLKAQEELFAIEAQKTRDIQALEADLTIQEHKQNVQLARAINDLEVAKKLNISVDKYMQLKILERFSDAAENGTSVAIGGGLLPSKAD